MNTTEKNISLLANSILTDHPIILDKIMIATGKNDESSKEVFEEVLKYLHVCSKTDGAISPSRLVDLAWHEFILHTKAYSDFCNNELGKFIHHIPGRKTATEEQYLGSINLINSEFVSGVRNEYWPNISPENFGCDGNPNCIDRPTKCSR